MLVLPALVSAAACRDRQPGDMDVFWGDLHIHTSYSMDAYVFNARSDPVAAYAFARGVPRALPDGSAIRLDRPLDFAAVTDHAEYFAVTDICHRRNVDVEYCRELNSVSDGKSRKGFTDYFLPWVSRAEPICPEGAGDCAVAQRNLWQATIDAAQAANEPCEFTTFVANEWTASPGNLHWHRNLIYATATVPSVPVNSLDQPTQESMWAALTDRCLDVAGCDVLAIPHNSNLGLGGSFRTTDATVDDHRTRARLERLAEIHQHKGSSECIPGSPLADENCGFEITLPIPLAQRIAAGGAPLTPAEQARIQSGYLRDTLARGLTIEADTGVNPFRYGLIGSTDSHSARPGYVEEQTWRGTVGTFDLPADRLVGYEQYNPGGLAAVWAEENTRASIFEALKARRTYATSGPRIRLQFQATQNPDVDLCAMKSNAWTMGQTVKADAGPLRMAVRADADRTPLARVQIVRLAERDGAPAHTLISKSVASSTTKAGPNDLIAEAGAACLEWTDTTFDANVPTLWYARVLEQPSPRWRNRLTTRAEWIQERAWSSPIFHAP